MPLRDQTMSCRDMRSLARHGTARTAHVLRGVVCPVSHLWMLSGLTLGKRLLATRGLGEKLLALGDGLAAESNALLGVEDGALPNETLDATGTTVDLVEGDLVDDLGAMLPAIGRQYACQGRGNSIQGQQSSPAIRLPRIAGKTIGEMDWELRAGLTCGEP